MRQAKKHVKSVSNGRSSRIPPEQVIAKVIQRRFGNHRTPVTVAVGGPGGTGKTTFARRLAENLGNATLLALDDYKTSREIRRQAKLFGPHPDANRMELISEHLGSLRKGETIAKPIYNRTTGNASETEEFTPMRWNIVEGEVATYSCFRDLFDFSVFIDSDWRTQLETRLGRDIDIRGYSPDKAVTTFLNSNLREFVEHGIESKQWADIHLFCNRDYRLILESVAQPLYGTLNSVLKSNVVPLEMVGLTVPVLSPFDRNGNIVKEAFVEHMDWLSATGIQRILIGGTTGEFFSLGFSERLEMLKLALEYFPGLVWFQVGGGPLPEAQQLASEAAELGADGIFCLPPAYFANAPRQGLIHYFNTVANATDMPFILYNFPQHTQNPLTAEIIEAVERFGLKDSAADKSLIQSTPRYFLGSNRNIPDGMRQGAVGFISAAANVWPDLYCKLEQAIESGDESESVRLQTEIDEKLARHNQPAIPNLKQLLSETLSKYPRFPRPPLQPITEG